MRAMEERLLNINPKWSSILNVLIREEMIDKEADLDLIFKDFSDDLSQFLQKSQGKNFDNLQAVTYFRQTQEYKEKIIKWKSLLQQHRKDHYERFKTGYMEIVVQ